MPGPFGHPLPGNATSPFAHLIGANDPFGGVPVGGHPTAPGRQCKLPEPGGGYTGAREGAHSPPWPVGT